MVIRTSSASGREVEGAKERGGERKERGGVRMQTEREREGGTDISK